MIECLSGIDNSCTFQLFPIFRSFGIYLFDMLMFHLEMGACKCVAMIQSLQAQKAS